MRRVGGVSEGGVSNEGGVKRAVDIWSKVDN